ncbi:hypothetical protein [Roseomonas gilardii]|uniref:hypothetical protein n=1 Tax=Roseomonas gilardii TaxID=257708 RepID=UPI001C930AED|nr:hypothetical protein [Roseomonas gilardii]
MAWFHGRSCAHCCGRGPLSAIGLGVSTGERRRRRDGIPMPDVAVGANSWESGRTIQTRLEERPMRR